MKEPKKPRERLGCGLRGKPDWEKSEILTASRGNGRRTRASGALSFDQMDVDWADWNLRVENKQTGSLRGFRISDKLLEKAWRQARNMDQMPALLIELPVAPEDPAVPERWVCLPESALLALIRDGFA